MFDKNLLISRKIQITNYSCVPACLEQVLDYYGIKIGQKEILNNLEFPERSMSLPKAGKFLISKKIKPGIVVNNIHIFDPAWFDLCNTDLCTQLIKRKKYLNIVDQSVVDDYIEYLKSEGKIYFKTISSALLSELISKDKPIIAEVASTYLYQKSKTLIPGKFNEPIRGVVESHGVVVSGRKEKNEKFKIVDPGKYNPYQKNGKYWINENLLLASIFMADGKSILYA